MQLQLLLPSAGSALSLPSCAEDDEREDDNDEEDADDDAEDDGDEGQANALGKAARLRRAIQRMSERRRSAQPQPAQQEEEGEGDEEDERSLAYNLSLFHRMQRSVAEIDALSAQKRASRQRERERQWAAVAQNRQLAELADGERRHAIASRQQRKMEALATLEQQKELARAVRRERQRRRHELAARRRQQQEEDLESWQQSIQQRLQEQDDARRRRRQQQQQEEQQQQQQQQQQHRPRQPQTARPTATDATSHRRQRPQSARATSAAAAAAAAAPDASPPSPDVLRERAQLYGQVVSNIFRAEAAGRAPPPSAERTYHQPHHVARSFSTYSISSFNVRAPVPRAPSSPPAPHPLRSPASSSSSFRSRRHRLLRRRQSTATPEQAEAREPAPDAAVVSCLATAAPTECSTLVMRNAALAVSRRLEIVDVPPPAVEEPSVPPYVIAAQYDALDDAFKLRRRTAAQSRAGSVDDAASFVPRRLRLTERDREREMERLKDG
ncbi:hypothetical protein PINS_up007958 [Pythium insidiosum]|nr:hypothetical protein PINS_up007958 [Pythium insidiosum]